MDTLKKLSMATKAVFLAHRDTNQINSQFPLDYLRKLLLLTSVGVLIASPGWAVPIKPNSLSVSSPSGTTNPTGSGTGSSSRPYVDDVILNSITFGSSSNPVAFRRTNNEIRTIQNARVITGRANINAEYGDSDTNSDGNPNPFVSAGIISSGNPPDATRESTNPSIQDNAIRSSYSSLSLTQGIDGEDGGSFSYDLIFQNGIVDNNSAADQVPELVFFERGVNSDFSVQAITGGPINSPQLSNPVTVTSDDMLATGRYIDTIEITGGQQLGVAGLDLNDFAVGSNPVYGIRVSSARNGPDMYGHFATVRNTNQTTGVPSALVPFELSPGLGILVLGALGAIAQLKSKVQKWNSRRGVLN